MPDPADVKAFSIDGKSVEGVISLKAGEKVGHYTINDYEGSNVSIANEVDNGSVVLQHGQQHQQFDTLAETSKDMTKHRQTDVRLEDIINRVSATGLG